MRTEVLARADRIAIANVRRCSSEASAPIYGAAFVKLVRSMCPLISISRDLTPTVEQRMESMLPIIERFVCITPPCRTAPPRLCTSAAPNFQTRRRAELRVGSWPVTYARVCFTRLHRARCCAFPTKCLCSTTAANCRCLLSYCGS